MPTNALGAGTVNLSVNVPKAFRSIVGRSAFKRIQSGEFRSVSEYIKHLIVRGMELTDQDSALQLRAIRNGALSFGLLTLICWSTWLSMQPGADDENMTRARRGRSAARSAMRCRGRAEMEAA